MAASGGHWTKAGSFVAAHDTKPVVPGGRAEGKRYLQGNRMYEIQNGKARQVGTVKTEAQGNRFLFRGKVPAHVKNGQTIRKLESQLSAVSRKLNQLDPSFGRNTGRFGSHGERARAGHSVTARLRNKYNSLRSKIAQLSR